MKLDTIKSFIIKYKRYFGACGLFILLVLVLAKCTGPTEPRSAGADTEQTGSENASASINGLTADLSGKVEKTEDEELLSLIRTYYKAYAANDIETLESILSVLTDNEKSYIETFSAYDEEYQNIECYALKLNESEYFASVCYERKFYEADTPAPGMDFFYIQRDAEGKLYINSAYLTYNFNFMEQELDATVYANILAYEQKEEVTALQQEVQRHYEDAVAADEKLANLIGGTLRNAMSQWREKISAGNGDTESVEQETQSTQDTETPTEDSDVDDTENTDKTDTNQPKEDATYKVKTKGICNVRESASKNSNRLGSVMDGIELTALGEEGDWTKVEFQGGFGYIRSDLLEKVQ